MSDSALWCLGRGSGVVSLVLLTAALALGVVSRSTRSVPGLPRFAVSAVHRSASLLAVTFLVLHVVTLTLDTQAPVGWLDSLVPFAGGWRPLWVGLGTLATDLLLAVVVTSLLRTRLGHRGWWLVHRAAYAAWPMAALHSLRTGTDAGSAWLSMTLLACAATVLVAVLLRDPRTQRSSGTTRAPRSLRGDVSRARARAPR